MLAWQYTPSKIFRNCTDGFLSLNRVDAFNNRFPNSLVLSSVIAHRTIRTPPLLLIHSLRAGDKKENGHENSYVHQIDPSGYRARPAGAAHAQGYESTIRQFQYRVERKHFR
jgi:hypothetical protein